MYTYGGHEPIHDQAYKRQKDSWTLEIRESHTTDGAHSLKSWFINTINEQFVISTIGNEDLPWENHRKMMVEWQDFP